MSARRIELLLLLSYVRIGAVPGISEEIRLFRMLWFFPSLGLISVLCFAQSPTNGDLPSKKLDSSYSVSLTTAPAPDLLVEASGLFRKGDFGGAIAKYKSLLQENPKSPDGWAGLIRSYLKKKDIGAAALSAEQALATCDHPRVRSARAEVLFRQGEIAEAEKEWVKIVNSGYPEARAYLGLARVRKSNAMYDGSLRMINKAHELKPSDPEITLMWLTTLPRPQRIEQLKAVLGDQLDLDASQRADISSYVDFLNDWSKQKDHQCRLVSNATASEIPLIPLSNERHPINEDQLFNDRRPELRGYGLSVALNGHRNVLLLDTGASGILVGRGFAEQAGIANLVRTRIGGIGGHGWTEGSVGIADSIKIGDMEFQNCPIRVTDSYFAADGDGLIGADVFEKFLIDIDFPDEKLRLSELPKRPGEKEKQLGLTNAEGSEQANENAAQDRYIAPEMQSFTHTFRFDRDLLVLTSIGDVPPKLFLLDTGAAKNSISPSAAEEVTKVHRDPHITMRGIGGTVSEVYTAKQAVIRFGHLSQKNQQMIGFDTTSVSDALGTEVSGFLGFATLRMLDITIDYRDGLANFSYDAKKWNEIKHKYR